ncbi:MAG: response regulator transcription factor [Puniceicoccales bacterium]|jgi:two-component system alkaline phosphatase synthesis response regulator PhoP|nr:response regulator transcription factor [Puniceicoccales bacterium]
MKAKNSIPFLLVVDGDGELTQGLVRHFLQSHLGAIGATTLREASRVLADHFINLMVLNTAVQEESGIEFLERLQRNGQHVPTIFIADRHSQTDRLRALEVGDDILQKPLHVRELVARVYAVLRRAETSRDWHLTENATLHDEPFEFAGATVHPRDLRVSFPGGKIEVVGKKELGLMAVFSSTPGVILARKDVIHRVWGLYANIRSRSLDQYVVRIRHLFRSNGCSAIDALRTVHGIGYLYVGEREVSARPPVLLEEHGARGSRRERKKEGHPLLVGNS